MNGPSYDNGRSQLRRIAESLKKGDSPQTANCSAVARVV